MKTTLKVHWPLQTVSGSVKIKWTALQASQLSMVDPDNSWNAVFTAESKAGFFFHNPWKGGKSQVWRRAWEQSAARREAIRLDEPPFFWDSAPAVLQGRPVLWFIRNLMPHLGTSGGDCFETLHQKDFVSACEMVKGRWQGFFLKKISGPLVMFSS